MLSSVTKPLWGLGGHWAPPANVVITIYIPYNNVNSKVVQVVWAQDSILNAPGLTLPNNKSVYFSCFMSNCFIFLILCPSSKPLMNKSIYFPCFCLILLFSIIYNKCICIAIIISLNKISLILVNE